jgi:hypothetical protein
MELRLAPFSKRTKNRTLGDASVNGDYAPHLHFQIIADISNSFEIILEFVVKVIWHFI